MSRLMAFTRSDFAKRQMKMIEGDTGDEAQRGK